MDTATVHPQSQAPPATVELARFRHKADKWPLRQTMTRDALVALLTQHAVRAAKDGPLWSPTAYLPGAARANANVREVTALVYEFDGVAPDWSLLDSSAYAAHSSHSHLVVCDHNPTGGPSWRVVLALTRPVPAADWPRVWRRARARFAPASDASCGDESRMYYLPSCPPGTQPETRVGEGAPVDPDTLPETPEEAQERELAALPPIPRPVSLSLGDEERPGDRFMRETSWAEILQPHGWRSPGKRNGHQIWNRPGRTDDREARSANLTSDDNLWVWTSSAPPFEPNKSYTKLQAHVLLEHGGDRTAAVKALAARYDPPLELDLTGISGRTNGHTAHGPDPIPASPPPPDAPTDDDSDDDDRGPAGPDGYALTDTGNAERLLAAYGHHLRYSESWHRWLVYDGTRWAEDPANCRIGALAHRVVRRMTRDAVKLAGQGDKKGASRLFKHALRSESAGKRAAMVKVAQDFPRVLVTPDELDADDYLLNCVNGTLDLRSGQLRPHAPADLLTKMAPVTFDPGARAPRWERALREIFGEEDAKDESEDKAKDKGLVAFVQRLAGVSITGDVRDHLLPVAWGSTGRNGKGLLLETLIAVLGDYATTLPVDELMVTRQAQHPTGQALLYRKRLVVASETEEGRRLAVAKVKELTGGNTITARRMNENFWSFRPTHTIWLVTNDKPEIAETKNAIWDRVKLLPFETYFRDPANENDAPHGTPKRTLPRDAGLYRKVLEELPGILAWAVRGCLEWQRDGLGEPAAVADATARYRDEMDVLALFLDDRCEVNAQANEEATALYVAYKGWCERTGERCESQRKFGDRLGERGYGTSRDPVTRRILRMGLKLRPLPDVEVPPATGGAS